MKNLLAGSTRMFAVKCLNLFAVQECTTYKLEVINSEAPPSEEAEGMDLEYR